MSDIAGYRLGDAALPPSPISDREFDEFKASMLFGQGDVEALRSAYDIVADQIEPILDTWYGFVGDNPHLLAYFSDVESGQPIAEYLERVRARFGQWILDTCKAHYDRDWLTWQDEIGRRHHRIGKNQTDGATGAAAHIPMHQILALVIPITATMRPFLASKGASPDELDAMHNAWTKSVLLQAILWARPYVKDGDF